MDWNSDAVSHPCQHCDTLEAQDQSSANGNQVVPQLGVVQHDAGSVTTLLMRNIPKEYTTEMLIDELNNQGFKGVYDFLYHPLDNQARFQKTFAILNFATPLIARVFCWRFNDLFLPRHSENGLPFKVVAAAEQGVQANAHRFYSSKASTRKNKAEPLYLHLEKERVLHLEAVAYQLLRRNNRHRA